MVIFTQVITSVNELINRCTYREHCSTTEVEMWLMNPNYTKGRMLTYMRPLVTALLVKQTFGLQKPFI